MATTPTPTESEDQEYGPIRTASTRKTSDVIRARDPHTMGTKDVNTICNTLVDVCIKLYRKNKKENKASDDDVIKKIQKYPAKDDQFGKWIAFCMNKYSSD